MTTEQTPALAGSSAQTSIRAVLDCSGGGRIVTMGFPGLAIGFDSASYCDPDMLALTLDDEALSDVAVVIALAERQEFSEDHWRCLDVALAARGARLDHLPIKDFSVPDARFLGTWQSRSETYHAILDRGGVLGLTCHYGAGRSGTIAAHMMIERGLSPNDAISKVRHAFPDSIESREQFDWLHQGK